MDASLKKVQQTSKDEYNAYLKFLQKSYNVISALNLLVSSSSSIVSMAIAESQNFCIMEAVPSFLTPPLFST